MQLICFVQKPSCRDREEYGVMWMCLNFPILVHRSRLTKSRYPRSLRLLTTYAVVIHVLAQVLRWVEANLPPYVFGCLCFCRVDLYRYHSDLIGGKPRNLWYLGCYSKEPNRV